jgi:hypothetical protein
MSSALAISMRSAKNRWKKRATIRTSKLLLTTDEKTLSAEQKECSLWRPQRVHGVLLWRLGSRRSDAH